MTEDGITRLCGWCGKSFNCTDGGHFCSGKCYDAWDKANDLAEY